MHVCQLFISFSKSYFQSIKLGSTLPTDPASLTNDVCQGSKDFNRQTGTVLVIHTLAYITSDAVTHRRDSVTAVNTIMFIISE